MSEQEQLSRSALELFGAEGYVAESLGMEMFYKVGDDLKEVRQSIQLKGFTLRSVNEDFYLVSREDKKFQGASFALYRAYGEHKGIWILDSQLGRYMMLMGVGENKGAVG